MDTAPIIPEFNFCLSVGSVTAWESLRATQPSQTFTHQLLSKISRSVIIILKTNAKLLYLKKQ